MTQPESRSERDPHKELVESFFHEMGVVSRTIGVISGGDISRHPDVILNVHIAEELKRRLPDISTHPIIGSTVNITIRDKSSKSVVYDWLPWDGGTNVGYGPVEGAIANIVPGIGVIITNSSDPKYVRFVHTTSYLDGEPTCDIKVLSIPEKPDTVT